MLMDGILLATGFTGALTLLWLTRVIAQCLRPPQSMALSFAPSGGCTDILVREIGGARREVLLMAGQLANRPVAQALIDARLRGAWVEVILSPMNANNPASDLDFLSQQGLTPLVGKPGLMHHFAVIDGKTLVLASFPLVSRADSDLAGSLLVVRAHAELITACSNEFQAHHDAIRGLPVRTPAATEPPPEAEPATRDVPEPAPVSAVPAVVARSPLPAATVPPATALRLPPAPAVSPDEEEADEHEEQAASEASAGPMVTPASADLFARLRKQLADEAELADNAGKAA